MKLTNPKFLSDEQKGAIRGFMQTHTMKGVNKDLIAEGVGMSRSTLSDALKEGHKISDRSWFFIEALLKRIVAGDCSLLSSEALPVWPGDAKRKPRTTTRTGLSTVELTGRERTVLSPEELIELKTILGVGHTILLPILKKLLHGDVGTRSALYQDEKTGPMIRELFTYLRGLQGEEVRQNVLQELDEDGHNKKGN